MPRWAAMVAGLLLAASIVIAIAAALSRGPWMDEFWTLWAADPRLGWAQALHERWLTDVHPPVFYAMSWLFSFVLGDDLALRRLQNLLPLAGLIVALVAAGRAWRNAGRYLAIVVMLTASSYFMTAYFAEYRSYFTQFCCGIVFFSAAYALLCGERVLGGPTRATGRMTLVAFAAAGVLLVNLHFVTALIAAIGFGGVAVLALLLGERRLGVAVCAAALLAAAPLAAILLVQAGTLIGRSGGHFWVETGLSDAVGIVAGSIAKGVGCNVVAAAAAGIGVVTRWRACGSVRSLLARAAGGEAGGEAGARDTVIGVGFLAVAAAALLCLLALNVRTPIIIDRYLVLCSAATICGLAILAQDIVFAARWRVLLLAANAAGFLALSAGKLVGEPRWDAGAALVGAEVARCPSTTVAGFQFPYAGSLANETPVLDQAYRALAARHGFTVRLATAWPPPPAAGQPCSSLLWTENVLWHGLPPEGRDRLVLDAARLALGGDAPPGAIVLRTKTGAVIVIPAAHAAP